MSLTKVMVTIDTTFVYLAQIKQTHGKKLGMHGL